MEYEPAHPFLWPDDPRTQPGELLWPGRFGPAEVEELKRDLGSYGAAGQLQQRPAPAGGGIFKRSWWRYYDPSRLPRFDEVAQSWDLAFEGGQESDYVVGQLWGVQGANKYLLRQTRDRLSFTDTVAAVFEMTAWAGQALRNHVGHAVYIEQAANGSALISLLRDKIPGLIPVIPTDSKISRAHLISAQVEAGNILLPGVTNETNTGPDRTLTPAWVLSLIDEFESFPNGANDDQVDAATQAIHRISRPGPRIRVLG